MSGGIDAFAVEEKLEVKVRSPVCLRAVRGGDRAENAAPRKLIARFQPFPGLYKAVNAHEPVAVIDGDEVAELFGKTDFEHGAFRDAGDFFALFRREVDRVVAVDLVERLIIVHFAVQGGRARGREHERRLFAARGLVVLFAVVSAVVHLVMLCRTKEWGKEERAAIRGIVVPAVGIILALVTAIFAKDAVQFVLLAYIFAFVLAAAEAVKLMQTSKAKLVRILCWVELALLVVMFVLLFVFTTGLPVASGLLTAIAG